ncbi:hypothetical protein ACFFX0_29000 [Citricoccus parietis]|uniref:Uncharacterized protein n=1 Tax=Citricoccus parietis TaxID=592307 RepID=A0ABV5G077_9MICC
MSLAPSIADPFSAVGRGVRSGAHHTRGQASAQHVRDHPRQTGRENHELTKTAGPTHRLSGSPSSRLSGSPSSRVGSTEYISRLPFPVGRRP